MIKPYKFNSKISNTLNDRYSLCCKSLHMNKSECLENIISNFLDSAETPEEYICFMKSMLSEDELSMISNIARINNITDVLEFIKSNKLSGLINVEELDLLNMANNYRLLISSYLAYGSNIQFKRNMRNFGLDGFKLINFVNSYKE